MVQVAEFKNITVLAKADAPEAKNDLVLVPLNRNLLGFMHFAPLLWF
jgi:hypothetical protein